MNRDGEMTPGQGDGITDLRHLGSLQPSRGCLSLPPAFRNTTKLIFPPPFLSLPSPPGVLHNHKTTAKQQASVVLRCPTPSPRHRHGGGTTKAHQPLRGGKKKNIYPYLASKPFYYSLRSVTFLTWVCRLAARQSKSSGNKMLIIQLEMEIIKMRGTEKNKRDFVQRKALV